MKDKMKCGLNLSTITKAQRKLLVLVVEFILFLLFAIIGTFFMGQTQKMYSFSAYISTQETPIFENDCTNVHVGKNHITYEKNGAKSTIAFPENACVKTDVHEYESDPSAAHKCKIALSCSYVCALSLFFCIYLWPGRGY